ncbi:MAG: hypothetical protein U9R16_05475 [Campylobacterota bacterium]|nr:hypothetical protein [Campylobacterota bacterium]
MMRSLYSLLFLCSFLFSIELDYTVENTNIITTNKQQTKDYNRVRLNLTLAGEKYENSILKLITDNENFYNKTEDSNTNNSSIYRGYFKYTDDKHLVSIGLQRIPFGVGRIWNPIDIFNPIDSTSIEPQNREGVESIRYEYAIDSVSNLELAYSKDETSFKIKSYLEFADFAAVAINDNKANQDILGYEIEGEFLNSGIELRSEGGYFKDKEFDENYYKYILGGEYGFENSLTILGEYLYDNKNDLKNIGLNISYTITPLLNITALNIFNTDDKSYLLSTTLFYSLSDEMLLSYGYFNYNSKDNNSQFSNIYNTHFLKLSITF